MFVNFQSTVVVFQQEKPIYVRERDAGMYDIWVYATTKLIAEQPIILLVPLLMNILVYFSIGFENTFSSFAAFYLILMLMIQTATSLGYLVSSFFSQESAAAAFAPALMVPINLLSGYMINLQQIWHQTPQKYIAWFMFFSPMRYGFNGMMLKEFPQGEPGSKSFEVTSEKLYQLGIDDKTYWRSVSALLILFVTYRCLVLVVLYVQDYKKRGQMKGDTRNTNFGDALRPSIRFEDDKAIVNASFKDVHKH